MSATDPSINAELTTVLCRGLSRLAVAAQGSDDRLDTFLAELRHFLRGDLRDTAHLARLVEAIGLRIKELDENDPTVELRQALAKLTESVRQLPTADADLAAVQQRLGSARLAELAVLAGRLASGQDRALAPLMPKGGRWARWFGRGRDAAKECEAGQSPLPDPTVALDEVYSDARRLLLELLRQIEPPALAADNYTHAKALLEQGLDGASLTATLEEVCQVIVAALEADRGEFQQFLLMLNQRLVDAHGALAVTQENGQERQQSDARLQEAVAAEVRAIKSDVADATSLAGLKTQVSERLNSIVRSLAEHHRSEAEREALLQQQLGRLSAQIAQMEADAVGIEQRLEEQRRLALMDTLTQLPNRQAYEERWREEWARSRRHGRPLVLALCDIDNFKSINDNFGHQAGDKVLRVIARTLRDRLRRSDFCARYGGEEFVLLLPETELAAAVRILEEIRLAVAACPFRFRDQPVAITLSAGLAGAAESRTPEQLFRRADEALYRAKQAGRNRCQVAGVTAAAATV